MGFENDFVAGLMSKAGGEQADVGAYAVTQNDDGTLALEKK